MTLEQFKARKSGGVVIKNLTKCRFIDDEGREIERVMYSDFLNGKDYVIYKNSVHEYRPYSHPCQKYEYIIGRI